MKRSIAFIFIDGVGIGGEDAGKNPFFAANLPVLSAMFGGYIPSGEKPSLTGSDAGFIPIDANLNTPGLPQSGTGQTALFTGFNAAGYIGKHFGPHPYSSLRPVITEQNIFRKVAENGNSFMFANAYPRQFFDYVRTGNKRLTVTTTACLESGIPLLTADDLKAGSAVSADITNERWEALGYPEIAVISPTEAGKRFASLAGEHTLTLFEYFLTDHAGHSRDMKKAIEVLERLDGFLGGVQANLDEHTLLIMTSDHGNIEDLSVKTHTRNAVPLWVYGKDAALFVDGISTITDIAPVILRWLNVK